MKHIVWLVSWYPDEISPYNGDFIQRHALAVAEHIPITVIYVAQHGPGVNMSKYKLLRNTRGNLTELVLYFRYKKTGWHLLDKLHYNWKYFYHFRKYIREYITVNGKPDLIHVHIPMKAGRIAHWLKQKFLIPYMVSEHSSAYFDEVPDNYNKRSDYYRKWVSAIFREATATTTVSQKLGNRLQELFNIQNMHIIPNVVNTQYFGWKNHAPERFRFLHISTMDHPKNVEGIFRTFYQLMHIRRDWECVMLGCDSLKLRKLTSFLRLNANIIWKGVVTYRQIAMEMREASALILFSRYENQPCVVLEALCSGLPVIATRVGGIPELIDDSNGILVNSENQDQLLKACLHLILTYENYNYKNISQQAQSRFSYQVVGKQFADLYEKYLGSA